MNFDVREGLIIFNESASEIFLAKFGESGFFSTRNVLKIGFEFFADSETYGLRLFFVLDRNRGVEIQFELQRDTSLQAVKNRMKTMSIYDKARAYLFLRGGTVRGINTPCPIFISPGKAVPG